VRASAARGLRVVFPEPTRRPRVESLGEEFRRGGGHAGGYETSLLLAAGARVDEATRRTLRANPVDLAAALRGGPADFRAIGGPRAYFGDPAGASREEGERLYELLAGWVADDAAAAL
jgi:creatinine amidohydrolase